MGGRPTPFTLTIQQIPEEEVPIERYKELAAAIVSRGVEDYCLIQMFHRDDPTGRFNAYYRKEANKQYQKYQSALSRQIANKQAIRKRIADERTVLERETEELNVWKNARNEYLDEMYKVNMQLRETHRIKTHSKYEDSDKRKKLFILDEDKATLRVSIEHCDQRIKDARAKIDKRKRSINNERKKLQGFKERERRQRKLIRPSYHHRLTIEAVEADETKLVEWFNSSQFAIFSDVEGQAILEQSDSAVYEKQIDKAVKYFYFIPTINDRD